MKTENKKNWLEWVVLFISGILVLFTLGFLVYEMIFEEQTSPDIVVTYGRMENKSGYTALPVKATNNGAETAENLRIEIIAGSAKTEEKANLDFDYLPGKSSATGWVTFKYNQNPKTIQVHVLGYSIP
ncbi:MAG: hypothetical protein V7767_14965 [Leeuwenhoekiella sp.]